MSFADFRNRVAARRRGRVRWERGAAERRDLLDEQADRMSFPRYRAETRRIEDAMQAKILNHNVDRVNNVNFYKFLRNHKKFIEPHRREYMRYRGRYFNYPNSQTKERMLDRREIYRYFNKEHKGNIALFKDVPFYGTGNGFRSNPFPGGMSGGLTAQIMAANYRRPASQPVTRNPRPFLRRAVRKTERAASRLFGKRNYFRNNLAKTFHFHK